ncbi:MAG: hypothetical protein N3B16_07605 [Candidatus Aminicenantes bacterium]|nr:hypothetical protein [Candidatus Aminicenantes bacterium]
MRDLLFQIKKGLFANLHYLSLFAALAIPDICGAIDSEDGQASKENYINWFDRYVAPRYQGFFTGEDCYYFRCSLLHHDPSLQPKSQFSRILFVEPTAIDTDVHCQVVEGALSLDVRIFCQDIIRGVEKWLEEKENTARYKINVAKFIRRYPEGLSPYIEGMPVIG